MRPFANLLLLLLALPGLVLPAGLWWHVCRCVAPMHREVHACCAGQAAATPSPTPCCAAHGDPEDDDSPLRIVPKCGCEWHAVGDDRPDPAPPEPPMAIAPRDVPLFLPFVLPATALPQHPAWARTTSRAPPGEHRNLPLRV